MIEVSSEKNLNINYPKEEKTHYGTFFKTQFSSKHTSGMKRCGFSVENCQRKKVAGHNRLTSPID
jgi:hypothetical protein